MNSLRLMIDKTGEFENLKNQESLLDDAWYDTFAYDIAKMQFNLIDWNDLHCLHLAIDALDKFLEIRSSKSIFINTIECKLNFSFGDRTERVISNLFDIISNLYEKSRFGAFSNEIKDLYKKHENYININQHRFSEKLQKIITGDHSKFIPASS